MAILAGMAPGLVRRLYERGYDQERVVDLFRFVDWPGTRSRVLLPAEVWREIERLEEGNKMPYITSVGRIGMERGKQEGKLEGKQATFSRLARAHFGSLPEALETRLATVDEAALAAMMDRVTPPRPSRICSIRLAVAPNMHMATPASIRQADATRPIITSSI